MSRITAREVAMHLLYELTFGKKQPDELLAERLTEETFMQLCDDSRPYDKPLTDADRDYIGQVVRGV